MLRRGLNSETTFASGNDAQQSIAQFLEVHNAGGCPDTHGTRRTAGLNALNDQRDSEDRLLAHAAADHVHIACLENPQPERTAWKQDCIEREQRNGRLGSHDAAPRSTGCSRSAALERRQQFAMDAIEAAV